MEHIRSFKNFECLYWRSQNLSVSKRTLKVLAAVVWYIGGFILAVKGSTLLVEAQEIKPGDAWIWLAIPIGVCAGGFLAWTLFSRICRKNLVRIDSLSEPKLWDFYRPLFFLELAAMIALGAALSRLAHGNFPFLISVAAMDIGLSTALLGSSVHFWKHHQN